MNWISTKDELPERKPDVKYSQVPCLVFRNNEIEILVFNHEYMVWDNADGDDFCCDIGDVSHWMLLPQPPK